MLSPHSGASSLQVLQILEQVQQKHTLAPSSRPGTAEGWAEGPSYRHTVRNGVGAVSTSGEPVQSPSDARKTHTRF